ncbi:MAG: 7TM diverse intracellular signaling domain-containing protein [Bacteroidota bacterium]
MGKAIYLFYIFFQGILFFQAFFLVCFYLITKKKDSLCFALFLFFTGINFFIAAPEIFYNSTDAIALNSWWFKLLNTPLAMLGGLCFTLFLKYFFADLIKNRMLDRLLTISIWIQLVAFGLFFVLYAFKQPTELIFNLENFVLLFFGVGMVVIIARKRMRFSAWVVWGFSAYIIGSFLTTTMLILRLRGVQHIFTDNYPFFFLKCGVLIEMTCYLIAIIKKWRYTENQVMVQKMESQLMLEKIRTKISGELHDDIGSSLSGISMYSYMADMQLQNGEHENVKTTLQTIGHSATEVVNKLGDLVWSVKPGQHSLEKMIQKLEQYGTTMCRAKNIHFKIQAPVHAATMVLSEDQHYHAYLCMKEAVNNAVKYSDASLIELAIKQTGNAIAFSLMDNGKGFDEHVIKKGEGIESIKRRAAEIAADCRFLSNPGSGTTISLRFGITKTNY